MTLKQNERMTYAVLRYVLQLHVTCLFHQSFLFYTFDDETVKELS